MPQSLSHTTIHRANLARLIKKAIKCRELALQRKLDRWRDSQFDIYLKNIELFNEHLEEYRKMSWVRRYFGDYTEPEPEHYVERREYIPNKWGNTRPFQSSDKQIKFIQAEDGTISSSYDFAEEWGDDSTVVSNEIKSWKNDDDIVIFKQLGNLLKATNSVTINLTATDAHRIEQCIRG